MTCRRTQLAALFALLSPGCALLNLTKSRLPEMSGPIDAQQLAEFQEQQPTRNVVRLQATVMSASDTDKRLRGLTWDELDESGLMSPDERRRLNESGIRVGVAGGSLPWSLESLKSGRQQNLSADNRRTPFGRSFGSGIAIPEDSRSIVELPTDVRDIIIPRGQIAGLNAGATLKQARCVLELTPVEYGDGWVVVRFLPQIHHGAVTTRYNMSSTGETMPVRQRIQPLYEQQFTLKLHVNETAIIGHLPREDWSVGRLLFQSDHLTTTTERLIALQLTAVDKVNGQKSLHVDYQKY